MKKLNRSQVRKVLLEELIASGDKISEMEQFAKSKSGKKVMKTAESIKKAGVTMHEIAQDQTGAMRNTLGSVSKFVYELGNALSGMDSLEEGESVSSKLPTVQEFKNVLKELQKLEKM
jgi:hypothetical protein